MKNLFIKSCETSRRRGLAGEFWWLLYHFSLFLLTFDSALILHRGLVHTGDSLSRISLLPVFGARVVKISAGLFWSLAWKSDWEKTRSWASLSLSIKETISLSDGSWLSELRERLNWAVLISQIIGWAYNTWLGQGQGESLSDCGPVVVWSHLHVSHKFALR